MKNQDVIALTYQKIMEPVHITPMVLWDCSWGIVCLESTGQQRITFSPGLLILAE